MTRSILSLALLLTCLSACRATPASPSPAPRASVPGYTLVLIRTGPNEANLSDDERRAAFGGHFANMQRMASLFCLVC